MGPGAARRSSTGVGARLRQRGRARARSAWWPRRAPGRRRSRCCVDRAGAGISRCYGTGGRDLTDEVGAITALDAIARLARRRRAPTSSCASPSRPRPRWPSGCCGPWPECGTAGGGLHGGRRRWSAVGGVHLAATLEEAALAAPASPATRPSPRARRASTGWRRRRRARPVLRAAPSAARPPRSWPSASATWTPTPRPGRARRLDGPAARPRLPGPGRGGVHPRAAPPDDRPDGPRRAPGARRRPIPGWASC